MAMMEGTLTVLKPDLVEWLVEENGVGTRISRLVSK